MSLRQLRSLCSRSGNELAMRLEALRGGGAAAWSSASSGKWPHRLAATCRHRKPHRRQLHRTGHLPSGRLSRLDRPKDVYLAPEPQRVKPVLRRPSERVRPGEVLDLPEVPKLLKPASKASASLEAEKLKDDDALTPLLRAILALGARSKSEQEQEAEKAAAAAELLARPTRPRQLKFIPRHHTQVSTGNPRYDALGRTLCRILRHQAVELGLRVRPDGYVRMDELLNLSIRTHAGYPMKEHRVEEVLEIVNRDPKRRYSTMVDESGLLYVRANQGHSMAVVRSEKLLREIRSPEEAPVCVHGTFRCYWPSIARVGLSRMGRNHVHFATGLPNDEGVLSGMEQSCEVLIYLDVKKALEDGMKIYVSQNGVLLTEGFGGIVPVDYFEKVVEWPSGFPVQ